MFARSLLNDGAVGCSGDGFRSLIEAIFSSEPIPGIIAAEGLSGEASLALPALLFVLSAFLCVFGQRTFALLRFLLLFAIGYAIGFSVVAPAVGGVLPESIIGVGCASALALLSKPVYYLFYFSAFGIAAFLLASELLSFGRAASLVAAAIALTVALLMRRWAEVTITAIIGGYGMCESVRAVWDFSSGFSNPQLVSLAVTLIIGFIGAVVQVRNMEGHGRL